MDGIRRTLIAAALVAALAGLTPEAGAADPVSRRLPGLTPSEAEAKVPVDVAAESLSADKESGWITALRSVVVTHGDTELRADRVRLNSITGEVVADGNVVLVRRNQGVTRSDRLTYNYKTGVGLTSALDLRAQPFRLRAESGRRERDGSFALSETVITTCTNAPGDLHWCATGRSATLVPNESFTIRGVTLRLFSVPFFHLPFWRRELNEHYGLRFVPGYESDWGGYLLSAYKFRLADLGDGDRINGKTHLDYRTERGVAGGQDVEWLFGGAEGGRRGFVSFYYISDDEPMNDDWDPLTDTVDSQRFRATFRHDAVLSPRAQLNLRASYLSDSYLLDDFYEDEYKALRQPENYAAYTYTGDQALFGIGAYNRLNDFYESVNRLPEIWFDSLRVELGQSRIFYETLNRGGWLQREFADYGNPSNPPAASYDTLRFDSAHTFYAPRTFFGFLSVVPRAGYRATYYGDTLRAEEQSRTATGIATNDAGVIVPAGTLLGVDTVYQPAGAGLRSLLELGVESSFKAYGLYEDAAGRYRHVLEPYLNYTFVPEPNLTPDELYQFDDIDKFDLTHNVRVGTRHQIQRKSSSGVRTPIDADLYGIYAFETPDGDTGLDTLGFDARFRPADGIRIRADAAYDVDAGELREVNTWLTLWNSSLWEATGQFFYRPDDTSLFAGGLTYALTDAWSINAYSRYEAENARVEEVGGFLQFQLDCIAFRLGGRFIPGFTRSDGSERDDDYRISFTAWLRAFPPERADRP